MPTVATMLRVSIRVPSVRTTALAVASLTPTPSRNSIPRWRIRSTTRLASRSLNVGSTLDRMSTVISRSSRGEIIG